MDRLRLLPWWARIAGTLALVGLGYFLLSNGLSGVRDAIFGNPEVRRERGNTVVSQEVGKAEANIADKSIERVRERDVYREHVRNVVIEGQKGVRDGWKGESVGTEVDAAGRAALCRLHDSFCGPGAAKEVQPVRGPVPGADPARQAAGR